MRGAEYFAALGGGRIQCQLCPRACVLLDGESGECRTRLNEDGVLTLPFYGAISSIAIDPIEKKPLRRFLPGTMTYSVGFWHCTMRCPFCQNWQIAHPVRIEGDIIAPDVLVAMAVASGLPSMSFTYSEPCLHIEYVKECMRLARARGVKNVLVTNGNLLEKPARDILALTDATNVDLKSFSASTYRKILGGNLETVKKFIQVAHEVGCHVEVTSLLVPGVLDQSAEIEGIADFIASVSREIPLHITPYHPAWRWDREPLTLRQREHCAAPAFERLDHVYLV